MTNCDFPPLHLIVHVFSDLFTHRLRSCPCFLRTSSMLSVLCLCRILLYARDYYRVSYVFAFV
jgi:hypothetical protein